MKSNNSRNWVEVAIKFSNNPREKILCPVCEEKFLTVTPVEENEKVLDVYLHCTKCKSCNVISVALAYQKKVFEILHLKDDKQDNLLEL